MTISKGSGRPGNLDKIASDAVLTSSLRDHIKEVVRGKSLSSSPRSQQFLLHIIEKSLVGDFESLKERIIAIELYNRSPSYDKSEDAIVRVAASDLRKRLAQHYKESTEASNFVIELPAGSYVPEITYLGDLNVEVDTPSLPVPPILDNHDGVELSLDLPRRETKEKKAQAVLKRSLAALLFAAAFFSFGYLYKRNASSPSEGDGYRFLPWSKISDPKHSLLMVSSDPDFAAIQDMDGHSLGLSDYANGVFFPENRWKTPETRALMMKYLQGMRVAAVDVPIITDVSLIARSRGQNTEFQLARSLHLADFHTDNNILLLGGPLANPWMGLFNEHLDFRFIFPDASSRASIQNLHPTGMEPSVFPQQGDGFDAKPPTGTEYAIIALLPNPGQQGSVLIVAGTGAESTAAAGRFMVRKSDMEMALNNCNKLTSSYADFEILLRVSVMAGSSTQTEAIACHMRSSS